MQVFSLTGPSAGTARDKRRWRLKWRIDGRDFSRSFKSKAEGDRLRSQLLVSINEGSRFDPANGLPVEWIRSDATWWTWSREWLELKWPRWAGTTRGTAVETLVALTPHLVAQAHRNHPSCLVTGCGRRATDPTRGRLPRRWSCLGSTDGRCRSRILPPGCSSRR